MQSLPRLPSGLFFRIRLARYTQPTITITAIIMPAIAPAERRCEEPEWLAPVPVTEVRLGIVAKEENEGWNEM